MNHVNRPIGQKFSVVLQRALFVLKMFFVVSGMVQSGAISANQESSVTNPGSGKISVPSITSNANHHGGFTNGKALIKKVEIKGTALYPEYGVTATYLSEVVKNTYQSLNSWMTVSDMQLIVDSITLAYHAKGLTFNQAYMAPKNIKQNVLVINVLPGKISEIHVKNNRHYSDEQIKRHFRHLLGKVVYEPDIQQAMAKANRTPGLKLFGFFSVGLHPGQTRLNLHVVNESSTTYYSRLDNYGVRDTGNLRLEFGVEQNNLTGNTDRLSAKILTTNESLNLMGALTYSRSLGERHSMSIGLMSNQFEVAGDFSSFGIKTNLTTLSASYKSILMQRNSAKAQLHLQIAGKQAQTQSDILEEILGEETDYITFSPAFTAQTANELNQPLQALHAALNFGLITATDQSALGDQFSLVELGFSQFIHWGSMKNSLSSLSTQFVFDLHYASETIPAPERQALTGIFGVRGYRPALFSADSTYRFSVIQTFKTLTPRDNLRLQPFGFIDYSHGKKHSPNAASASFLGAGVGIQGEYSQQLSFGITLGVPVSDSMSQDANLDPDDYIGFGFIQIKL